MTMTTPDLPPPDLLTRQAERLSALRGRIFRRLGVAHLGPVLDLGAGHGAVTGELVRRSRGPVVALDRRLYVSSRAPCFEGAHRVAGDGKALPFADDSFALIFVQLVFLWERDMRGLVSEIARVLKPSGSVLAVEPDYGGMIEWPPALALEDLWLRAIERAGGDPFAARKLPGALESAGLRARVDLLNAPSTPDPDRFGLLGDLLVDESERALMEERRRADAAVAAEAKIVHLPFFFVTGSKGS